jgi:hypothetical protein
MSSRLRPRCGRAYGARASRQTGGSALNPRTRSRTKRRCPPGPGLRPSCRRSDRPGTVSPRARPNLGEPRARVDNLHPHAPWPLPHLHAQRLVGGDATVANRVRDQLGQEEEHVRASRSGQPAVALGERAPGLGTGSEASVEQEGKRVGAGAICPRSDHRLRASSSRTQRARCARHANERPPLRARTRSRHSTACPNSPRRSQTSA